MDSHFPGKYCIFDKNLRIFVLINVIQISGAENGGYTPENSRSSLNLFLQKNRQPTDMDVS